MGGHPKISPQLDQLRHDVAEKKMKIKPIKQTVLPLILAVFLLTACGTPAPPPVSSGSGSSSSSSSTTTTESTPTATAETPSTDVAATETTPTSGLKDIAGLPPQKGSAFNKFFPKGDADFKVTFTQEKEGFAEIKVSQGGTEVAKISISDTVTNLTARSKFESATDNVNSFPMVAQGKKSHAALVGDRYQVKVMSRNDSFTEADRKAWLAKVDLAGLAKL